MLPLARDENARTTATDHREASASDGDLCRTESEYDPDPEPAHHDDGGRARDAPIRMATRRAVESWPREKGEQPGLPLRDRGMGRRVLPSGQGQGQCRTHLALVSPCGPYLTAPSCGVEG